MTKHAHGDTFTVWSETHRFTGLPTYERASAIARNLLAGVPYCVVTGPYKYVTFGKRPA